MVDVRHKDTSPASSCSSRRKYPTPRRDPFFSGSTGTPPSEDSSTPTKRSVSDPMGGVRPPGLFSPIVSKPSTAQEATERISELQETLSPSDNNMHSAVAPPPDGEDCASFVAVTCAKPTGDALEGNVSVPKLDLTDLFTHPDTEDSTDSGDVVEADDEAADYTDTSGQDESLKSEETLCDGLGGIIVQVMAVKDGLMSEENVVIPYDDPIAECIFCRERFKNIVDKRQIRHEEKLNDESCCAWICKNPEVECKTYTCVDCAVQWANREISLFRPPTCSQCDFPWSITLLCSQARQWDPLGLDKPLGRPLVANATRTLSSSGTLIAGMRRFRKVHSQFYTSNFFFLWLKTLHDDAGWDFNLGSHERMIMLQAWNLSFNLDVDRAYPPAPLITHGKSHNGDKQEQDTTLLQGSRPDNEQTLERARPSLPIMPSAPDASVRRPLRGSSRQQSLVSPVHHGTSNPSSAAVSDSEPDPHLDIDQQGAASPRLVSKAPSLRHSATAPSLSTLRTTVQQDRLKSLRNQHGGSIHSPQSTIPSFVELIGTRLADLVEEHPKYIEDPKSPEAMQYRQVVEKFEEAVHTAAQIAAEVKYARSTRAPFQARPPMLRSMSSIPTKLADTLMKRSSSTIPPVHLKSTPPSGPVALLTVAAARKESAISKTPSLRHSVTVPSLSTLQTKNLRDDLKKLRNEHGGSIHSPKSPIPSFVELIGARIAELPDKYPKYTEDPRSPEAMQYKQLNEQFEEAVRMTLQIADEAKYARSTRKPHQAPTQAPPLLRSIASIPTKVASTLMKRSSALNPSADGNHVESPRVASVTHSLQVTASNTCLTDHEDRNSQSEIHSVSTFADLPPPGARTPVGLSRPNSVHSQQKTDQASNKTISAPFPTVPSAETGSLVAQELHDTPLKSADSVDAVITTLPDDSEDNAASVSSDYSCDRYETTSGNSENAGTATLEKIETATDTSGSAKSSYHSLTNMGPEQPVSPPKLAIPSGVSPVSFSSVTNSGIPRSPSWEKLREVLDKIGPRPALTRDAVGSYPNVHLKVEHVLRPRKLRQSRSMSCISGASHTFEATGLRQVPIIVVESEAEGPSSGGQGDNDQCPLTVRADVLAIDQDPIASGQKQRLESREGDGASPSDPISIDGRYPWMFNYVEPSLGGKAKDEKHTVRKAFSVSIFGREKYLHDHQVPATGIASTVIVNSAHYGGPPNRTSMYDTGSNLASASSSADPRRQSIRSISALNSQRTPATRDASEYPPVRPGTPIPPPGFTRPIPEESSGDLRKQIKKMSKKDLGDYFGKAKKDRTPPTNSTMDHVARSLSNRRPAPAPPAAHVNAPDALDAPVDPSSQSSSVSNVVHISHAEAAQAMDEAEANGSRLGERKPRKSSSLMETLGMKKDGEGGKGWTKFFRRK